MEQGCASFALMSVHTFGYMFFHRLFGRKTNIVNQTRHVDFAREG
jgi:hypothetical protein